MEAERAVQSAGHDTRSWVTTTSADADLALGGQQEVDQDRPSSRRPTSRSARRRGPPVGGGRAPGRPRHVDAARRRAHPAASRAWSASAEMRRASSRLRSSAVGQRRVRASCRRDVLDGGETGQQVVGLEDEPELLPAQPSRGHRSGSVGDLVPADHHATRRSAGSRAPIRPRSVDFPHPLGPMMAKLLPGVDLER